MSNPDNFVGPLVRTELGEPFTGEPAEPPAPTDDVGKPRSLAQDAWQDLRRNPLFIIGTLFVALFVLMAAFPQLFTDIDPRECQLSNSRQPPSSEAWFGYDLQGCDVYARTVYGARASILVGIFATLAALLVGGTIGMIGGFFAGWADSITSRLTDVFLAVPLFFGAILILTAFPSSADTPELVVVGKVALVITLFGWTSMARIMRSSAIQVKNQDFVHAARALGASSNRIILRHVLPNSLAPVIVVATISLGAFIAIEATLSWLGIGLQPPVISWGIAINEAARFVRLAPHMLFFPALFLSLTVLAFIMLGDAVRDALDPKLR